jgi:hypothetical protein
MDIPTHFLAIKAVLTMHTQGGRIDDSQYGNWQQRTQEERYNYVSN